MEYLPYERIAQLVTISAMNRSNSAMANFVSQLKVSERTIRVKYSDYVKSQVHLNISYNLYGRAMCQYVKSMYYLNGNVKYRRDAEETLRYFYHDMASFLINNPSKIELIIEVDADLGTDFPVDVSSVCSGLGDILEKAAMATVDPDLNSDLESALDKFEYSDILDEVIDLEDAREKLSSYALAAVLRQVANAKELHKVRLC